MSIDETVDFDEIVDRLLACWRTSSGSARRGSSCAGEGTFGDAAGRGRDRAGAGPHRTGAERARARVPGRGRGQVEVDGRRAPRRADRARSATTGSACRRILRPTRRPARPADRADAGVGRARGTVDVAPRDDDGRGAEAAVAARSPRPARPARYAAGVVRRQAVRCDRSGGPGALARALRRLSARRSSSDSPPQTPASCPDLERPGQALLDHRAAAAHGLGLLDLQQRRPGVPDREEQLRVLVTADCAVTPVHVEHLSFGSMSLRNDLVAAGWTALYGAASGGIYPGGGREVTLSGRLRWGRGQGRVRFRMGCDRFVLRVARRFPPVTVEPPRAACEFFTSGGRAATSSTAAWRTRLHRAHRCVPGLSSGNGYGGIHTRITGSRAIAHQGFRTSHARASVISEPAAHTSPAPGWAARVSGGGAPCRLRPGDGPSRR